MGGLPQQPAAESMIHELAKPVARTVTCGAVEAAFAALVAAAYRNLRGR